MELIFEKQKPTKKFLNFRTVTTSSTFSHSVQMDGSVLLFNLFLRENYNSLSFPFLFLFLYLEKVAHRGMVMYDNRSLKQTNRRSREHGN